MLVDTNKEGGGELMNTKEAIEFMKSFIEVITSIDIRNGDKKSIEIYNDKINRIIDLLKRGEKYEAMWKELKYKFEILHKDIETGEEYYTGVINKIDIKELEQKYFPKPSDNFTEKVMEKINKKGEV